MKKHITIALALVTIVVASSFTVFVDCTSFEQFTQGTTWTMSNYDGKGKLSSRVDCNTTKVTTGLDAITADVSAKFFDGKGKENGSSDYTLTCSGGDYEMDMRNFVTPEMKKGAGKDMEIKIEGDMLEYPSTMKAGDALPNGTMKVMIVTKDGQVTSTTNILIKDRKCEAVENKTTPAGTWECYKITYTMEMSIATAMMTIPMKPRTATEWFSFKVGSVRSESYKNGEMESYSELTAFKKP